MCTNVDSSPYYRCGACPRGYAGNGTTCVDVDEVSAFRSKKINKITKKEERKVEKKSFQLEPLSHIQIYNGKILKELVMFVGWFDRRNKLYEIIICKHYMVISALYNYI
jgi:hypothetical protein